MYFTNRNKGDTILYYEQYFMLKMVWKTGLIMIRENKEKSKEGGHGRSVSGAGLEIRETQKSSQDQEVTKDRLLTPLQQLHYTD